METKLTPLRKWRGDRKPADVAAAAGVTVPMWNRWELGRRKIPHDRVVALEALTGIPRHVLRPDLADLFAAAPKAKSAKARVAA